MAKQAGLWHLGVVYPHDFLPVEAIVAAPASIGGGDMILRFEGGIERAAGHMTQLALPRSAGKHAAFVAAVALQVPVRPAQLEPCGKVIKPRVRLLGPGDSWSSARAVPGRYPALNDLFAPLDFSESSR